MLRRAGIIGCGRIGCGFGGTSCHAGSYSAVDGVDLVAVCDLDKEKAHACATMMDAWAYTNYRDMLSTHYLDIVSVCTPPETHEEIVCDVSGRMGMRAIYCEKPIATSVSAAERMVRACDEHDVLLMINHQRRFSLLHQEVARIVREGELGHIQQVTCYYGHGVSNSGSHLFDLLRFYFGEAEAAFGGPSQNSSHRPDDPNIDGWLWFEGNVSVTIQACDCEYVIFEINVVGAKGRLRVIDSCRRAELERIETDSEFAGFKILSPPTSLPYTTSINWMPRGVEHMLDCLKTDRPPISSGRDGLAALKIIEALKSSARGE